MSKITLNPPPRDERCECCSKHISELKDFDGYFKGAKLVKNFRDFNGCIGASWECVDCFGLNKKEYMEKKNEKGRNRT